MSDIKTLEKKMKKIQQTLEQSSAEEAPGAALLKLIESTKDYFDKMDPDDKKTMKNKFEATISKFRSRRQTLGGNAKGGSISKLKAGGFPDLSGDGKVTQKDVLMGRGVVKKAMGGQVNGLKKMGMKVGGLAGRLAQRGYGKARR
jgi:hypothetical protein|tara:strand:+ start:215 stop:649 length:435 start_codon:yes stop_codon:yes gene_type:complete